MNDYQLQPRDQVLLRHIPHPTHVRLPLSARHRHRRNHAPQVCSPYHVQHRRANSGRVHRQCSPPRYLRTPDHLPYPPHRIRIRRRAEDLHTPRRQINDEDRVIRDQTTPRPHFRRKEIGAGNDTQFRKLCQMLGKPEMADDPRFRTNRDRLAHKEEMEVELRNLTKDRDGESFANELMQNGVPSGVWPAS